MKAYKITVEQKNAIEGQPLAPSEYYNPVQDINGDWFIFEIEMNHAVKNKGWAKETLAEYVPPPTEELI
jgi:hypothetical protein